jgi:hypothetical protein
MFNSLDCSWHAMHRIVDQRSMIHRRPLELSGDLADSESWKVARRMSNLDRVLSTKLQYSIALRACGVRPHIVDGYPPGLVVVPPSNLTVIPYPYNDLEPMVVIEYQRDNSVSVWDMSDRENPKYEIWRNISSWRSGVDSPMSAMNGEDYPWYYRNEPILPWVIYQGDSTPSSVLPVSRGLVQDTIDIILQRTWLGWVGYVGSFDRAIIMSDTMLTGYDQAMLDPSVIVNLFGDGSKSVSVLPNSTDSVSKLWEIHSDRVQEIANKYSSNLYVRKSDQARSGVAIQLEMSGLWQYRSEQETLHKEKDRRLIEVQIASWNYCVRSGYIDYELLPESDFDLRYPTCWTADEQSRLRSEVLEAVKSGLASPVDYYLVSHDLPDTESNRVMAMERLQLIAAERLSLIRAGLLVDPTQLMSVPASVPS